MLREGMYQQAVANGMELLDRVHPGWRNKIDWDELIMESPKDCILGQLYGGFEAGKRALNIGEAALYGFDLSQVEYFSETPAPEYFWELQAEWKCQARTEGA